MVLILWNYNLFVILEIWMIWLLMKLFRGELENEESIVIKFIRILYLILDESWGLLE